MQQIVVVGAGKSSIALIDYLVTHAATLDWEVVVADRTAELAYQKTQGRPRTKAVAIAIDQELERRTLLNGAAVVVSMLPASFHALIAADCLALKKHLVTPSYISPAMQAMDAEVKQAGLIFMNEMGLDPGIDHMSAMQIFDQLRGEGARITGYRSHCGGLVAPESDTNSWHYKFSWNPRNVVLAGQGDGGIRWKENGALQEISYHDLFRNTRTIQLGERGTYETYPNRDSLKYAAAYGLEDIATLYRGTLRVPPFCKAWQQLVEAGATHATEPYHFKDESNFDSQFVPMLKEIGLFETTNFNAERPAADDLQVLLESRWVMQPADKDLVVMVHEVDCEKKGVPHQLRSSLVLEGKDSIHTAMALTVGLPVAIVVKMILTGALTRTGVLMPNFSEVYNPVMQELMKLGISFHEEWIS
ncbi:MAG: saccharopine dehydrogenase family protein [Chitinophagales bacterium]